jgi:hypothetical protein
LIETAVKLVDASGEKVGLTAEQVVPKHCVEGQARQLNASVALR